MVPEVVAGKPFLMSRPACFIHRRELARSGDYCHASQLPGCGRGDHTAHRGIRYSAGTVEAARPMNRDARRPGGNAAEVLAEARRGYAAKLATSLKWVQSS